MRRALYTPKMIFVLRCACIGIGVILIILGIVLKTQGYSSSEYYYNGKVRVSLVVECRGDAMLQEAIATKQRLNIVFPRNAAAEESVSKALRSGMEVVLQQGNISYEQVWVSGAKGILVDGETGDAAPAEGKYFFSLKEGGTALSPDFVVLGTEDEARVIMSQAVEYLGSNGNAIVYYREGCGLPLSAVIDMLQGANFTLLSQY
ncbi:hypothetical protein LJB83_03115 [Clostridia bacterium OttesenSCG-928-F22]|nr:hypothetical protein [Clostridia bacterium OttesenSCG-928-F22]